MRIIAAMIMLPALFVGPAQADDSDLENGRSTYKQFCAHCHGIDMKNPGTSSYDLRKWPVDQKAEFYDTVQNGKGDMPAWGDILLPEELDAIWHYVATRGGQEPLPDPPGDG